MTQKYMPGIVKGYKATDANICCRGLQYVVGEWQEVGNADDLIKCGENGLHFCPYPSGPWNFYSEPGTRLWEIEAEGVLDEPLEPGAAAKRVARRIRLVKEIIPDGDGNTGIWNTGNQNTGNRNTGNRNTGNRNTGDWNTGNQNTGNQNTGDGNTGNQNTGDGNTGYGNTGYGNTGYGNTGYGNTGYGNTGYRNTGDRNTGNRNTGDRNTGDRNTGNRNTGDGNTGNRNTGNRNTGNRNTGNGNATDYSSGSFCTQEPNHICFDIDTGMKKADFCAKYPEIYTLEHLLAQDEYIEIGPFSNIPGITKEKLLVLHTKHKEGRK